MDRLDIKALSVNTRIGIHVWEQRISQRLLLDISIPTDCSQCHEEISNTIDYDKLCQIVTSYVETNSFKLIETVANNVADLVKTEFNVSDIIVRVSKPHAIKNAGDIQITVNR